MRYLDERDTLWSTALAVLASTLIASGPIQAQETPQALAETFVAAVQAGDRAELRALVHPTVLEEVPEGRIDKAVSSWADHPIPADYEIELLEPSEVEEYDPDSQAFDMGGFPMRFPVAPGRFFQVIVTREQAAQGEGETVTATGGEVLQAASRHDGRWYLVIPTLGG